jgi:hypothetical protein
MHEGKPNSSFILKSIGMAAEYGKHHQYWIGREHKQYAWPAGQLSEQS